MGQCNKPSAVQFCVQIMKIEEMMWHNVDSNCQPPYGSQPFRLNEKKSKNVIPDLREIFRSSLLLKSLPVPIRVQWLCNSMGQNILYSASCGKLNTVKHIKLGIVTKRKTELRLLTDIFNQFGYCILYDERKNVPTSFVKLQVSNQAHQSFVPNNLRQSSFVKFV